MVGFPALYRATARLIRKTARIVFWVPWSVALFTGILLPIFLLLGWEIRPPTNENGVVLVMADFVDGSGKAGTGFLVSPTLIMTAGHVVCEDSELGRTPSRDIDIVFFDQGRRTDTISATWYIGTWEESLSMDYAILEIEEKPKSFKDKWVFPIGDSEDVQVGDKVECIGFLGKTIDSGKPERQKFSGEISMKDGVNPARIGVNMQVVGGMSGAPVLYKGKVIGVATSKYEESSGIMYVLPTRKILKYAGDTLNEEGIDIPGI